MAQKYVTTGRVLQLFNTQGFKIDKQGPNAKVQQIKYSKLIFGPSF